ncbi:tetratricopeptide repeat protein [Rhizobium leguminosarum]|uniref:tetratricopeptide repeat protein n=1 Tax=Rhizobium leguminosarum TaxID=384 RepID=UPI0010323275|nr:hypothetical protein [Rhizobium leguminosarum]TAU85842.1 hypothetical protein ELI40_22390 [Rhizobium leguminosarum]
MREALDKISTALENWEFDYVERTCRAMLRRLEGDVAENELVNEIRSYLIHALTESHTKGGPREAIVDEFDRLFTGYLSVRDKASAANVLTQKVGFLREEDWSDACATARKVVDLFGLSDDEKVMAALGEAHLFLLQELPSTDQHFVEACTSYGKFLQRRPDPQDALRMILEIDDALDGAHNVSAVSILEGFLSARLAQLSLGDETSLRSRLAANYLYIGRFEDAINTCNWLLINGKDDSSLDYLLWCGEAYLKLGRDKVAAMYFREVQRALASEPDDERAKKARDSLDQLAPETD